MAVLIEFGYLPMGFHGYAEQPGERTVEGEIFRVLETTGAIDNLERNRPRSSSRTDRGVGALSNFISVRSSTPPVEIMRRLNSMIQGAYFYRYGSVDDSFNPRAALYREYVFFLLPHAIGGDMARFKEAVSCFRGTHCFHNFSKKDRTLPETVTRKERTVDLIEVKEPVDGRQGIVEVIFRARSFLYGQVRKMVGAAAMVARGEIGRSELEETLAPGCTEGRFPSHPPGGLYLYRVKLPPDIEKGLQHYAPKRFDLSDRLGELRYRERAISALLMRTGWDD